MDDVRIVTVDVLSDDVMLDQWVDAAAESGRHEFGDRDTAFSADELRAAQRLTTDADIERLAAVVDGVVVAQATVHLPLLDNQHFANFTLTVRPAHRRRGIGGRMLRAMEDMATAHGRTTYCVDSQVAVGRPDPAAQLFAAHGYTPELVELRSDLDRPASGVDELLAPLGAEALAHASGYDVLTWWDDVPDEWIDQRARGPASMSTAAIDRATGQMAAFTDLNWC